MKRILSYISLILGIVACQEKADMPQPADEPVLTTVSIDIAAAGDLSKANTPLVPDVENLIHDIWVIQFSERGVRYTGVDRFYRTSGEDGARFLTFEAQVMSGKSTICLLANLGKMNTVKLSDGTNVIRDFCDTTSLRANLPDNLPQFKSTLLDLGTFLHHVNTNSKPVAVPMFGYWEGNIGSGSPALGSNSLNVTLGRMVCRLNVTVANRSESRVNNLTFTNASNKAYYFPQTSSDPLPDDAYCTNPDACSFTLNLPTGNAGTIYFYWAPNFCYGEQNATKMTISDDAGNQYHCYVTNSSVSDENCDYNMYHNCNYTITVTVQ